MVYGKQVSRDKYDVIIIGSGISGLSCAALMASEGLSVLVAEQHRVPGGSMTMFKRGDFWFEGGGHRISGVREPGGVFYQLLKKIGKSVDFHPINPSYVVKIGDKTLEADICLERYIENLHQLFPDDKDDINRFIHAMTRFVAGLRYVSSGKVNPLVLVGRHRFFLKSANKTVGQFVRQYTDNQELIMFLTAVGTFTTLPIDRMSFLTFANMWAVHHMGEGMNLIDGGTRSLIDTLVGFIENHGGEVAVSTDISSIVIEDGKAVGVMTAGGQRIKADAIVSSASNQETFLRLVGEPHLKKTFVDRIKNEEFAGSLVQVFLGIDARDGRGLEHVTTFVLGTGDHLDDQNEHYRKIANWDLDAICEGAVITVEGWENAPEDTRSINISCLCPYLHPENWFLTGNGKARYNVFKEQLADKIISNMSRHIPSLEERIIVKNIATPLTLENYTRATRGGIHGLAHTVSQSGFGRGSLKTPVKNLYRAGQYIFPGGGILPAGISGKNCAEYILKKHFGKTLKVDA